MEVVIPRETITTESLSNLKEKTIIEKLCLLNSTNDLNGLNYNKYGKLGHTIKPIGNIFCDNFVLSAPARMDNNKKNLDVGIFNRRIDIILVKNEQRAFIKAIGYKGGRQKYKVSCNSIPLEIVKKIIEDRELTDHDILLEDIDITQDFSGSFNKQEVMDKMLSIGYSMQGETGEDDETIILENSKHVGDNCLTFVYRDDDTILTRSKIYNKFAQQVESDSVRDNFGHHIHGWCMEKGFQEGTIKKSLEHGITRVETTYYYNHVPEEEEMESSINSWKEILTPDVVYSTPIHKQWEAVTERISRNLVIKTETKIAVCHWVNTLTGKVGGIIKDTDSDKDFQWMLSELTFHKPIDIIFTKQEENLLHLSTSSYVKTAMIDNISAQLVERKYIYQRCNVNPEDVGIPVCNGVGFYGNDKINNKKSKTRFTIEKMDDVINIVYVNPKKTATLLVKEMEEKNKEYKENIKLLKKNAVGGNPRDLVAICSGKDVKKLTSIDKGTIIEFKGAVERNTRYGKTYILVEKGGENVYWANSTITAYLNKLEADGYYGDNKLINVKLMVRIKDIVWTAQKHKAVLVEIVNYTNVLMKELANKTEPKIIKKRENNFQNKDYKKLETLSVGDILLVEEYGVINVRGLDKYVVYTDKGNFMDNQFLRDIYDKKDTLVKHQIICRGFKTTKQKAKCMDVSVVDVLE